MTNTCLWNVRFLQQCWWRFRFSAMSHLLTGKKLLKFWRCVMPPCSVSSSWHRKRRHFRPLNTWLHKVEKFLRIWPTDSEKEDNKITIQWIPGKVVRSHIRQNGLVYINSLKAESRPINWTYRALSWLPSFMKQCPMPKRTAAGQLGLVRSAFL